MAPKKLTDCPENLREAIDWLIQVRHGSGSSDGLGNLSKALKKLIDEAIATAFTSNVDPLLKLINPSCGKSDNCTSTFEEIQKLKKQVNESGNVEADRFRTLLRLIEEHKIEYEKYHYAESSREKALEGVKCKLSEIDKLRENLETFNKNPNDILTNLCTGLETFLGFNPDSKGYTGTGIVYSDLDRLCDAVMAFLHGVFDTIKSEDAVDNYNKYLPDYNKINKVIQTLEKQIGQGRNGIPNSVGQVKAWLEGYESVVKTNTQAVKDELRRLIDDLEGNHKMTINENSSLEAQLSDWKSVLHKIEVHVTQTQTKHISRLDRRLEEAIANEIKPIKDVVQQLKSVTYNAFETQVKAVDTKFETLPVELNNQIEKEAKRFKDILDGNFNEIGGKVESFRTGQLQNLMKSKDALSAALHKINGEEIGDKKSGVHKKILALLEKLRVDISNVHKTLEEKKKELDQLVITAQMQFATISRGVKEGSGYTMQADLSIEKHWKDLYTMIETIVGDVTNAGKKNPASLQDIVEAVQKYAETYGQDFGGTVKKWVPQMVGLEPMKGFLNKYVVENDGASLFSGSLKGQVHLLNEELARVVQGKIIIDLDNITVGTQPGSKTGVDGKLSEIVQYLRSYAKEVVGKHTKIVSDIEVALTGNDKFTLQPSPHKSYLESAVKATLAAVKYAAEGAAEEIETFIQKSNIVNLTQSISKVKLIGTNINPSSGVGFPGGTIDVALTTVKGAIDQLNPILQRARGTLKIGVDKLQSEVLAELENFKKEGVTGRISSKLKVVTETLEDLKAKIDREINVVVQQITDIEEDVETWINQTKEMIKSARQTAKSEVSNFNAKKQMFIRDAFEQAKSTVMSMLAKRHQAYSDSLKKLVVKQKYRIEGFIQNDRTHGLKGFLRVLYGGDYLSSNCKGSSDNLLCKLTEEIAQKSATISNASPKVNQYFNALLMYVYEDIKNLFTTPPQYPYSSQIMKVRNKLEIVLERMEKHSYDFRFVELLVQLNESLAELNPKNFGEVSYPALDVVKAGLNKFTEELDNVYVNKYSGAGDITWEETSGRGKKTNLTVDGRNCSKVCLTLISILNVSLGRLKLKCNRGWKHFQIHQDTVATVDTNSGKPLQMNNPLGPFFMRCGYNVSVFAGKQKGELRNEKECNGMGVHGILVGTDYKHVYNTDEDFEYPLQKLYDCLQDYYTVGHYASSFAKKQPCSVYEMLGWMCGLKYNPVQSNLLHSISDMLEEPATPVGGDGDLVTFDLQSFYINTYPNKATYKQLDEVINHIMSKSASILTTVLGYGDEHTTYACDFYDNSLKLYYPKSGEECLDMLLDILRRMLPPLRFLFMQCRLDQSHYGWADCYYGEDVYPLNWQCKDHEDEKANCRPRSALQSYLSDSLVGCMPHQLSAIGCKATCSTCPKGLPGMPCLTPLGFRGFSGSKRRGADLSNVLGNLFGNPLLASLFALAPKAPSTLPEHFQFALSLVYDWQKNCSHPIENGIKAAITDRSIALYEQTSDLTNALSNAYGSSQGGNHAAKHTTRPVDGGENEVKKGDLCSLAMSTACRDQLCAPYLYALCTDQYTYLAKKQCKTYLSWAVYLPWTLWNYLNSLYNAFKDIYCQDWGCRTCLRADTCRRGQHGLANDKTKVGNCHCSSIVECKGAMPTLYKYGFTFGAPAALNGQGGRKTCTNFMDQLNNVLQSKYFQTLFDRCDDILWQIRQPFTWTVIALWLLSLLYLLHIMVIRLDLLHIKSHLHSPSSHRIAAQSLLAAARVKALNKVLYLQP
ncbi:hypothetical protein BBBOND_0304120 [Babesia bigemina]|uniref:C3H1-type domain-containing protein n=1 Tax=Babesia bigemina TaxID=5866 RepID=A0A061D7I8_BABBI|nr:hypothetical protein BBBOND_0304120 [Babesia bigemina]CDR96508.1 hypothetical protein BBBOND_0304120 [Babesia bigemina]|eukprot:XP_012768694.1 hypothetical protein BBBOND_0304120 [Babesia bigemina]